MRFDLILIALICGLAGYAIGLTGISPPLLSRLFFTITGPLIRFYDFLWGCSPDALACPWCGCEDWESFTTKWERTGVQPGTPDGPPAHWGEGQRSCSRCFAKWFVSESD